MRMRKTWLTSLILRSRWIITISLPLSWNQNSKIQNYTLHRSAKSNMGPLLRSWTRISWKSLRLNRHLRHLLEPTLQTLNQNFWPRLSWGHRPRQIHRLSMRMEVADLWANSNICEARWIVECLALRLPHLARPNSISNPERLTISQVLLTSRVAFSIRSQAFSNKNRPLCSRRCFHKDLWAIRCGKFRPSTAQIWIQE